MTSRLAIRIRSAWNYKGNTQFLVIIKVRLVFRMMPLAGRDDG